MRLQFLAVIFLFALCALGKSQTGPLLISHNDIKGPIIGNNHTEDLKIFADGRVSYKEEGNDRKKAAFATKLSPQKLHKLIAMLNSKEIAAVPAEIGSQIRVVDFDWEKQMEIHHGASKQTITVKNFYPLLNSQKPAYPKALIELECMLQEIQRSAARRPAPRGSDDWCPDALGQR
jgi:hypothetical protein